MTFHVVTERMIASSLVLRFEWHGGAYIDVSRMGRGVAEVIDVWGNKAPTIARTREAFNSKVDAWIAEYGRDALAHDVLHNWYG